MIDTRKDILAMLWIYAEKSWIARDAMDAVALLIGLAQQGFKLAHIGIQFILIAHR